MAKFTAVVWDMTEGLFTETQVEADSLPEAHDAALNQVVGDEDDEGEFQVVALFEGHHKDLSADLIEQQAGRQPVRKY